MNFPKSTDMNLKKLKKNDKIMKIKKTKFKGLLIVKQKNNIDKRGSLRETFNNKILKKNLFLNIVQLQKKCF